MKNDSSSAFSSTAADLTAMEAIEAEIVDPCELEDGGQLPIVYLAPRPYLPEVFETEDEPGATFPASDWDIWLERLMTPWGIAGLASIVAGNLVLLGALWLRGAGAPLPAPEANLLGLSLASPDAIALDTPTASPSSLNLHALSILDDSARGTANRAAATPSSSAIPAIAPPAQSSMQAASMLPMGSSGLTAALLPPALQSPEIAIPSAPVYAAGSGVADVPSPQRSRRPAPISNSVSRNTVVPIPQTLRPTFLPPPPPLPTAQAWPQTPNGTSTSTPTEAPAITDDQRLRQTLRTQEHLEQSQQSQGFNAKTRQQMQNLVDRSPQEEGDNSGLVDRLRQQSQQNIDN
jgi:hypothetical protein